MSVFDRRNETMPRAELEQVQLERLQALRARTGGGAMIVPSRRTPDEVLAVFADAAMRSAERMLASKMHVGGVGRDTGGGA